MGLENVKCPAVAPRGQKLMTEEVATNGSKQLIALAVPHSAILVVIAVCDPGSGIV